MGLSVLGLRIFTYSPSWMTATSLLLVSWIAWGDFAFAILRRWHGRIAIWRADEQHLHHRLVRAGLAPRIAVASLWIVSGLAVATGIATFLRSQERVWASALVLATLPVVWAASRASGTTRREPDSAERKSAATIASNRAA